ncbi:MAG: hypothetical protein CMG69_00035 [Candidatus Marinimicrobia bacterium]|nr:hypothetical protein [Candidatus Neomarinimicrobiota bacterium]|tara:strand:- start:8840 stop:10591 length:1752 start_codon:yes stop_codon:yes gene_type:complete
MKISPAKTISIVGLIVIFFILVIMYNGDEKKFGKIRESYLDWYFRANPVTATWIGIHTYDSKLPLNRKEDYLKEKSITQSFLTQLRNINPNFLNLDDQVDYDLMVHSLNETLFYLSEIKSHTWDPTGPVWTLGSGYETLMGYNFSPKDKRAKSLSGRIQETSLFLENAEKLLDEMPKPHLETAINQCEGLISVMEEDLLLFVEDLDSTLSKDLIKSGKSASNAIKKYQSFLEKKLDTGPHRNFRLGESLYNKLLPYTLNEGISAEEVLNRAHLELRSVQMEMLDLAVPLHKKLFKAKSKIESHDDQLFVIEKVLNKIADDHVERHEVVKNARETIDELNQFILEKDLLTLDPSKPLEIRETPEYQRGFSIASLQAPGPLEDNLKTYYNVSPIPEDWSEKQAESFLREYNRISVKILSIHEALPGHYVQLYYANRHPSIIRSILGSGVMIEGWAHYTEGMMIDEGFGNGDPRYSLVQMKWKLRGIANAIIDQKIHAGTMTEEEAIELMVDETFQEEAEASAKWRRAQLSFGQLSTYFVGSELMLDLKRDIEQEKGSNFNLKDFHEELLSHGSVPIRHLRRLMLD